MVSDCKLARKAIDKLLTEVEVQAGNKAYWVKVDESGNLAGGIAKFLTERKDEMTAALGLKPGDFVASPPARGRGPEDRRRAPNKLGWACEGHMDKERYEFCWIVDFPMYEIGEESGELEFCHNPFSMPTAAWRFSRRPSAARSIPCPSPPTSTTWSATAWSCPPARSGTTTPRS